MLENTKDCSLNNSRPFFTFTLLWMNANAANVNVIGTGLSWWDTGWDRCRQVLCNESWDFSDSLATAISADSGRQLNTVAPTSRSFGAFIGVGGWWDTAASGGWFPLLHRCSRRTTRWCDCRWDVPARLHDGVYHYGNSSKEQSNMKCIQIEKKTLLLFWIWSPDMRRIKGEWRWTSHTFELFLDSSQLLQDWGQFLKVQT